MGEVYRARDTRLHRIIALKVLPHHLSSDPERRQRFEREARAVSSLNHPHICTLYDIGRQDGVDYIVMEYLEGQTLAERLESKGPLSLDQLMRYAIQIADALDKAHRHGVIHRDLKPSNIILTKTGAKLLDFGLAKLRENTTHALVSGLSVDATGAGTLTGEGTILGTLHYMAPEQLEGKETDARTDIFGFGAVLHEMATGKRPFEGESQASLIAAILEHDPAPVSRLQPLSPPALDRVIQMCLAKDPDERWQSAHDIKSELEWISSTSSQMAQTARVSTVAKSRKVFWIAAALIFVVGVLGLFFGRRILEAVWVELPNEPIRVQRLTDFEGLEEFPAISPDGKSVAFTADVSGNRQVWVRLMNGGAPLQITHDPGDHLFPRWSYDSTSIIYYSPSIQGESGEFHGALWEISALGGAPRRIASSLGGADLSHDDRRITFFRFHDGQVELTVAARDGSNPQAISTLEPSFNYLYPRWSPDDQWIGFQRSLIFDHDIRVVPANGGQPRQIVPAQALLNGFAWLPDGDGIIYSSAQGNTILYLPIFNLWTAALKGGQGRQLTFGESSYVHPDLKNPGKLVSGRVRMRFDIWKYPVNGSALENVRRGTRITHQTGQVQTPSVSPDDKELVYLSDSGGHANLWIMKPDGTENRQITFEQDPDLGVGVPVWSPDGKYIAFVVRRPGAPASELWLLTSDGSRRRRVPEALGWACWSSDSRWLYHGAGTGRGLQELRKTPVEGGTSVKVQDAPAQAPAVAPDGTAVYYVVPLMNINGISDMEIRVARPENARPQVLSRIPGWRIPAWQLIHPVISPDGKWLAIPLTDSAVTNMWALPTGGGPMRQLTDFGQRRTLIARRVSWSSDGKSIYAAVGEAESDIVLLEKLIR